MKPISPANSYARRQLYDKLIMRASIAVCIGVAIYIIVYIVLTFQISEKAPPQMIAGFDHAIVPAEIRELKIGSEKVIKAPPNEMWKFKLSDGTAISLMPTSTLTLPTDFGENTRSVDLDGEARFEIKERNNPFYIHAGKSTFMSTGTFVDIKAHAVDSIKRIWVTEGSVTFYSRTGPLEFKPYWQRLIDVNNDTIPCRGKVITFDRFVYMGADLAEVMRDMARWFNISINYSAGDKIFTGAIFHAASINEMMEIVSKECKVKFTAQDNMLSVR